MVSAQIQRSDLFTLRGTVREKYSYEPIKDAEVYINGGNYASTNSDGEFRVKARIGDQLEVRHDSFETVYWEISSEDRIIIEAEYAPTPTQIRRRKLETFNATIDSAITHLKKDAGRSIQFVVDALENSTSVKQSGTAYETLGDIYSYWKQYDLAITNYKISLQNLKSIDVSLKLGNVYRLKKDSNKSIATFNTIKNLELTNWQKVILYEGLGDAYLMQKEYSSSIESYNLGLNVAKKHLITPKITDLNSKIAKAYSSSGSVSKAEEYFDNSLKLASKENKKRALEEQVTVADFQNANQDYQEEIELRKVVAEDLDDIESDSLIDNESALTPQKQNYKIGNAYFLKGDYENAIPYLKKSIDQADKREDLIVKKDATKKLSDVHRDAGDFKKAVETYETYTAIVDELYIKKNQELSQAERFNRKMAESATRIASLESARELSQSKYELSLERNKNQQIIIYSLSGGLLLLLVSGYFMFGYIKQQRFTNNLLALKSLRSQMNPHFIFNALNSVNSFISASDERTANKYLTDFSYLMRAVLENSEEDFIPLQKEIELIELYTKLEHFRFKDKFDYEIDVDLAINMEEFKIPPMLLQPYIENAVWHGLRYKEGRGHLKISITQENRDELKIIITDDGIGRKRSQLMKTENQRKHKSAGMTNIKKRVGILNTMYKDKVNIEVCDHLDNELHTGTKVVVTLKKD